VSYQSSIKSGEEVKEKSSEKRDAADRGPDWGGAKKDGTTKKATNTSLVGEIEGPHAVPCGNQNRDLRKNCKTRRCGGEEGGSETGPAQPHLKPGGKSEILRSSRWGLDVARWPGGKSSRERQRAEKGGA